jgi:nitrate/nitrite transporter NarK
MSARWLTPSERLIVVNRVSGNMMGIMDKSFKAHQVREALLDPRLWLLYLAGAANGIVSGGLGYFASALIKGYGFSGLNATLLQLPTGILELIALPVAGWIASRYKNMRCIVYVVFSLIPLGGLLGIRLTSLDHQWSLMGSTWLLYIFAVQSSMSYSLLASNVAGHTKRATANGLWFVIWSAGSVGGVNSFNADEAPRYFSGITVLCSCMVASMVLILILRHAMWWENRRRDKKYGVRDVVSGEADDEGIRSGFLDRTDVENKHFRYAL